MLPQISPFIAASIAAAALAAFQEPQEKPKVPKDSIELTVIGCLKGRVLKTVERRSTDVESGPHVGERTFRLAGKRDVMDEVKRHNGHLVEVVGVVKRSDLDDRGLKVGPATINGGAPTSGRGIPSPAEDVAVMDATSVRLRSSSCTPQ
jgi:hypothetical protein